MRPFIITVGSTPSLCLYALNGPKDVVHRNASRPEGDSHIQAVLKALGTIKWLTWARRLYGPRTKGRLLPLVLYTDSPAFHEAGTYLCTLEETPKDMPEAVQMLHSILRNYRVSWRLLDADDQKIRNLKAWAETVAA